MKFKRVQNKLEDVHYSLKSAAVSNRRVDDDLILCPKCYNRLDKNELINHLCVCMNCRHHFRQSARQRINFICDEGSFDEMDAGLESVNILDFPEYDVKLEKAKIASAEHDAVVCGFCRVNEIAVAIFAMEPFFMMGSMGIVVGEKITRLFERAIDKRLPMLGFAVSGGARMQEGILSLMQMAKISGAVRYHSDAGHLYICTLSDPTTGGVVASFAMQADIIIVEPFAYVGFAGRRVIEQTIRMKLPEIFQQADFLLEKGFVDDIVDRKNQKNHITKLLKLHNYPGVMA